MFKVGLLTVLAAGVWLASCTGVQASSPLPQDRSFITVPEAGVMPQGTGTMTFNRFLDQQSVGRISYSFLPNFEVGLSNPSIATTASDWRLDGKFRVLRESEYAPEFSAGFRADGYYLVLTKSISDLGMVFDVGMGNNSYEGGFLGIAKYIWIGKVPQERNKIDTNKGLQITLMADYMPQPQSLNAGIRVSLSPQMVLDVGLINLQTAMIGLSFWDKFE